MEDGFTVTSSSVLTGSSASLTESISANSSGGGKRSPASFAKLMPAVAPPHILLEASEQAAGNWEKEKEVDDALYERIRCTALARLVYGDDHWKVAETYANLANTYLKLKEYPLQAELHSKHARTILLNNRALQQTSNSDEKTDVTRLLVNVSLILGTAETLLTKFSEAEKTLQKCEKLCKELESSSCSDSDQLLRTTLHARGRLYLNQPGKAESSVSYLKQALKLLEKQSNSAKPDSEDEKHNQELLNLYRDLGQAELKLGNGIHLEKSVDHLEQARGIANNIHGEESSESADLACLLASAWSQIDSLTAENQAESWYKCAVETYTTCLGDCHVKTLKVQDDLAKFLIRTDNLQESFDLLTQLLPKKEIAHGEYSEAIADSHKLMGSILLSQGQLDAGIKQFEKCLEVEKLVFGDTHKKPEATQKTINLIKKNPKSAISSTKMVRR